MALLLTPIQIRDLKIRNRIFVSPMCQYSCQEGVATNWHLVHLGSRAVGGAGVVIAEATGVSPEGRISPNDLGLWNETQMRALKPIVEFIHAQGAASGVQLAHAGRKASTARPWDGGHSIAADAPGGWQVLGPSPLAYDSRYQTPKELDSAGLEKVKRDFGHAANLAQQAGFQVIEIHMAHGYLLHQFLSPLSNQRNDQYGGTLENRMRFPLQIAEMLRKQWPAQMPVFVRISASDWVEGGWTVDESVIFCRELEKRGIDLIDVSSGGLSPLQKIEIKPHYQVPFAEKIKQETELLVGAVGLITETHEAEDILQKHQADVVFMAREFLRDPYWPLHAAHELKHDVKWPVQYDRAKPR